MTLTYADDPSCLEERDALVDALVAAQDRLSALVALMRLSSDTLDLDELTLKMLEEALELTESDAVVLSWDHGRPNQRAAHAVVGVETLQRVLDEQLRTMQLGLGSGHDMSWTVVPFPSYPEVGIAVGRLRGPAYTTGDIRMLHTVALAIEQLSLLSRLHQEVVRQATVKKEHQLASRLAQAVLPSVHPALPGVDFFARCSPASLTGGDFMVFAEIDGVLWVAVGDVAGKGLPAAMIMTQAVAAVRVALRNGDPDDPAAALTEMGADLGGYLCSVESFITLAVAAHRPGSGTVALSNAGHSPVVYVPGAGEAPRSIGPSSPPLGVIVPRPPRTVVLPLPPGAALVIGTDGLVEQPDPAGDMLGYDVFLETCATPIDHAGELGEQLFRLVDEHADGTPAADDRTLVVLRAGNHHDV